MKLGKAFSDNLITERKVQVHLTQAGPDSWWSGAGRAIMFASVFCLIFFVLLWRLFDLTLIQGRSFRALADGNRVRELVAHAPRGLLLDRTGKPLVGNLPQYRLLTPCTSSSSEACVRYLSQSDGEKMASAGVPAGSFLEVDYQRQYPYGGAFAHLIGYTGELTKEELDRGYYASRNYRPGDRVGRTGAEAVFEERLRGRDGRQLVEVDASGKSLRVLGKTAEIPGEDITLAVDAGLALAAEKAFPPNLKGAIVVTKPTTGEVLALYSSPSFDPNKFSLGMSLEEYQQLQDNPDRPMFDRATGGAYPPGSTFKIVTALAGLSEGAIGATTTVEDVGVIRIGTFTFPNWYFVQYGKTEGLVDIVRAIARSNDIFFYKVGEWLGITKLAAWAHKVGIGRPLGIELGGEASGLVPDPAWKNQAFNSPADLVARSNQWYLGDTYHVAIGQGYLLTTPLQVNTWTNIVASGGNLCRPTIGKVQSAKFKMQNCKDLGLKKEHLELVVAGMKKACDSGGTGWPFFDFALKRQSLAKNGEATPAAQLVKVPVACKTGTAEFGDPAGRTHAWFTVFAPLPAEVVSGENKDNTITGEPEISVTVLLEGAGEGSNVAAPVAKKLLEEWFSR